MPVFRLDEVRRFGTELLTRAGATEEEAGLVVQHHIDAMLDGDGTYGYSLGTQFIADIKQGLIQPGRAFKVEKETPTTLAVHGNFNFGHYVSHHVMLSLIEKAKTSNVAAATIKYQCHVGRLIDYTAMAAREGMIALMMCDGAWGPKFMAPTGGKDRRLGINPWSIALPNNTGGVVGFDMTAGVTAASSVTRAHEMGERIPEGWIVDKEGQPTTDPGDYFRGGSFLPLGGIASHKGYALCFVIEVLADILSGMEFQEDSSRSWPIIDGCFMAVFNVEAFRPLIDFKRDLDSFIAWVKSARPIDTSRGVLYPGELATIHRKGSVADELDIPLYIWSRILRHADELGIAPEGKPQALRAGSLDDAKGSDTRAKHALQSAQLDQQRKA
jgi:LDH2 family malate/lactate/ureidoglycolate dehydrogenase